MNWSRRAEEYEERERKLEEKQIKLQRLEADLQRKQEQLDTRELELNKRELLLRGLTDDNTNQKTTKLTKHKEKEKRGGGSVGVETRRDETGFGSIVGLYRLGLIHRVTNSFDANQEIGRGGFGRVFKGKIGIVEVVCRVCCSALWCDTN